MSSAVEAAVVGAAYNSPALARDMVQTATVGSIVSATDAARQTMPAMMPAAAPLAGYGGAGSDPAYAMALANTSARAQQSLMTLASQNQLLETLMQSV